MFLAWCIYMSYFLISMRRGGRKDDRKSKKFKKSNVIRVWPRLFLLMAPIMKIKITSFMPMIVVIAVFALISCTHPVTRTEVDKTVDQSGKWNDSDSRLAAETLIHNIFSDSWLKEFKETNKRKPIITTGRIANRTHEHIPPEPLINELTTALLKSGEVSFIVSGEEKEQAGAERQDYRQSNKLSEVVHIKREADFLLTGEIHTIIDELMNKKVVFYQINIELLSLGNNLTVWEGQTKIKKIITKPKVAW